MTTKLLAAFFSLALGAAATDLRAAPVVYFGEDLGAGSAAAIPNSIAARNAFAQTVVPPYSVRVRPHAPVSTPLDWSELEPSLDPTTFHIGNFARRLEKADPWAGFWKRRRALPKD